MQVTQQKEMKKKEHLTYPMLVILFCAGSLLGFLLEGIWFFFKHGQFESHSALVWGPFCIVYGFGTVAVYILAMHFQEQALPLQFIIFSFFGGAVEYFTGLLQEILFHSTSWDYSDQFLNLGGHVSLSMALLWGALGTLFVKLFYPSLKRLSEKLAGRAIHTVCIFIGIFFVVDMIVSAAAVLRWGARQDGINASNQVETFFDQYYGDEKMEKIYSNMRFK